MNDYMSQSVAPNETWRGLTILDHYAAAALQGLLAHIGDHPESQAQIVAHAFDLAEAMISERGTR